MPQQHSAIDWRAVRAYYEAGHTRNACQRKFGFSNGAWNRAVKRGEIAPRPRSSGLRAGEKRAAVARLRSEGKTYAQICKELGMAKSTVAYHCRRIGLPVDEKARRRYDWDEVQVAYDSGLTVRECAVKFGFTLASWTAAVGRGAVIARPRTAPLADYLVVGRTQTNRVHLRNRLINEGYKERRCERCAIEWWQGEAAPLEIHHRNGDPSDNRLVNLEILCSNCHALTDNWGGRNRRRTRLREAA